VNPTAKPRLFLVDGYALVYRAFHAVGSRPLSTRHGENTSIPWGIANFLERLRKAHAPTHLGWVHDAGMSGREVVFPAYKATRIALEMEQRADFERGVERVGQLLRAQGIPLLRLQGYEADDVIATLAQQALGAGIDTVVVSPDKDLLQLVRPGIRVLNPYHGRPGATIEKWYDESNALERLGVPPRQVVDYLGLVGDSSDNVPGVKGIGEKGALELLARWDSIEAMLDHLDEVMPLRARNALREHESEARLSKQLATLRRDCPITLELAPLTVSPPDTDALRALYVELEFAGLARSLGNTVGVTATVRSELPTDYRVVNTVSALNDVVGRARKRGRFVLSTETELEYGAPVLPPRDDKDLRTLATPLRANLIAISIALAPGEAYYLPLGHRRPEAQSSLALDAIPEPDVANLPPLNDPGMAALTELLADESVAKIGHDAKYDMLVLRRAGVTVLGVTFDTKLAAYLLEPSRRSYALDVLVFDLLRHTMTQRDMLRGKGRKQVSFAEVGLESARDCSCECADYTCRLFEHFAAAFGQQELSRLLTELELPLVAVLAEMEWTGVAIDTARLESLKTRFQAERQEIERRIWAAAGEEFNINSTPKLREILFDKLGLPAKKRTATGASTDATVLQELADEGHALPVLLMDYRELSKLENTYLDTLPLLVNPRTGRLHTSYSQTAATGRLSSSDPNLQNIPVRTELGRAIRRGFVPRAGWKFLAADYSQVELRLLAHMSGDPAYVEAFRAGGDIHKQTATVIFGVDFDAVTPEMRARAKTINFATIYGQGAFSLSKQLKIEVEEAKRFIATYFERFAGVRRFLDQCVERARERGYSETIFGRRRWIPELREKNYNVRAFGERIAQNSPIQGSAADLIKFAMLRAALEMRRHGLESAMLLQVHDELVFEGPPSELPSLKALVTDAMENVTTLSVPLLVDVGIGDNWLDAKAH
jgi:DNA polymerase-1